MSNTEHPSISDALIDDLLSSHSSSNIYLRIDIEAIEEQVAMLAQHMQPSKSRAELWTKISAKIINEMEHSTDSNAFFLPIIEMAISTPSMYERTNLPLEVLIHGVANHSLLFDWPRYRAAAILYAPFLRGVSSISISELDRLSFDINLIPIASASSSSIPSTNAIPVPQSVPGLGTLISDPRWSVCDRE